VGEFNATDPDNNAVLTYHLVSGTGDGNNSLFLLETNGTLKTAVPFDFESNASNYSIRVQVKDEHNASMESSFTVTLSDDQNEDTDGDGFPDGLEITHGSDPWDLSSMPNQSPTNLIAASPLYNDQKNTFAHSLQRNWLKAAENVVANALGLYPNSQKSWDIKVYDAGYPIVLFPKYVGSSMQIDEIGFGLENFNPPHTQPDSLTDLAVVAKMTELILSQNSYYSDLIGDDSNNKDSANWFKEGLGKFVRGFDEGVTPFLNNLSTDLEIDTLLASFGSAPIAQSSALSYLAVRFLHRQIAISGAPSFYGVESNLGIKHLVTWISEQFKSGQDSSNCGLNAYFNFYPSIGFSDTDSFMVNFTGSFGRVFIKNEIIPNLENSDTGSIMGSDSSNGSSLTNSEVVADANGSPLSNAIFVLDIDEDQPVGTPVATFGAFDPDGDSLVFSLTNGLGSNHNHLFSLEQNGTLKTAVIFDYEDPFTLDANSSRYSIRVAAIDDENASIERVFKFDLLNNSSDDVHEVTFSLNGISSDSQAWDRLGNLSNPPSGWSVSNSNFYEFDLDTYSTSGKFILEVNSGGNGERYILLQDSDVIFDTAGGPMSDMKWSTAGSSYKYDYDRFEIIYYPGMDTLFKFVPLSLGDSTDIRGSDRAMGTGDDLLPADNGLFDNKSDYIEQLGLGTSDGDIAQPWNAGDDYSNIRFYGGVGEVGTYPSSGSSTKLTLRVEADSIFVLNAYYEPLTNYPPSDLNSTGTLTIAENQPIGTIVGEFNANDPDVDATLSFSLVEGHGSINNALFSLETNGTLKTAVPFDFESNASNYTIRVQVKDEHNASAESQFVIGLLNEVEDLDGDGIEDHYDNDDDGDGFSDAEEIAYGSDPRDPTSVANQLPTALPCPPSLSILENQPAGTMIGQFSANDPDANTTLTFSMVQGTIALHLFDLDQDGDLEILTEDLTGNFSVNQNLGSSFTQRNNLSLPGHTAIQSNNNLFSLSSDGILRSMVTFDFESDPVQFLVQVQVRDEHNASISQTFTVDLHNTNEAPNNLDFTGSLSFLENQPAGTLIGKFTASDPDINSTLNYQLVDDIGGEHHSPFILDPNGSLFTASTLDYESTHSAFALHVRVSDEYNSGTEGNFTVSLINDVEDWDGDGVEDHYDSDDDNDGFNDAVEIAFGSDPRDSLSLANTPPVFVQGPTFFIPENEPIGTTVASISALDPDNNSSVPVVMNSPSSAFSYDFNQTIRTAEIFDFEANHTSFSLLFSATDEFNATTNHEIIIEVTNVVEDMDNDGFEDAFDLDIDGDGLENTLEISTGTDPLKPDTDEDGLLDGMEYSMGSNPLNMDTDYDGLTDKAEYEIGTNPLLDDTDLDGFKDQEELLAFTSPEDANDYPGNSSLKSHNEAPDGKFYELITEGHSLEEAKELAKNKGADLPYLTHHKSELNKFLIQLLIRSQIDSAWALGDKSFLPWYIKRNNPLMLFTSTRGFSYSYAIGESTKLPVLLVREKSAVQKAVVLTLPPEINSQTVLAKGQILDSGGDKPFRVGFRISEKIMVRDSDTTARMISGISNQDTFQATIERLTPGKSYYVRAFAENSAGLKYGSVRKIKVEKTYLAPFDASALSDNWYNSVWFGAFKHYETKWIFHNELGWLYHGPVGGNGIWFWTQKRGWLWTVEQVWPYLWQHESANWLYYLKQEDQAGLYFDFSLGQYTD
jgi:hypothetical protein